MTAPLRQSEPNVVKVALDARGYDILIGRGLLADLGQRVKALRPGSRAAIVTDETVGKIHLSAAEAALKQCGVDSTHIIVPAGENSKNYATFEKVCEAIIAARLERNDLVVALGGGVVGDLAGFAASCVRRGLDFVQVPTTLLAQVDSSVGGKTGINSRQGKNLIGAFHQPIMVIADTALLDTLSKREFRAGYAEVAKFGLLGDGAFFAWLEKIARTCLQAVQRGSTRLPSAVVERPASLHAMNVKQASARCSTSDIRSAMRSKLVVAIRTGCCTGKQWHWASSWHSNSPRAKA